MTLPERVVALHRALARKRIPHAFGGAIALAYWTLDPRGTSDIDLNVFVPAGQSAGVLQALPEGVQVPEGTAEAITTDGQVRIWWDTTPLDLFFDYVPLHMKRRATVARSRSPTPGFRFWARSSSRSSR